MTPSVLVHQLPNGLVLIAEPLAGVESAAFTLLLPAGAASDPADRAGLANLTCELTLRGCGSRDKRQFLTDLDNLGVDRGESVNEAYTRYSGATLADRLPQVFEIYADLILRPHLPPAELPGSQQTLLQEIYALEDELQQKVMVELKRRHYPEPFGRPASGDEPGVLASTIEEVGQFYATYYRPNGAILGVAGKIDWDALRDQVERLFGDWAPAEQPAIAAGTAGPTRSHLELDSHQTHIAVAYPTHRFDDPLYYHAGAAVMVLSGGMSSRLFTEVREKRGLCYSVYAGYHAQRGRASVQGYAGSQPDRAQDTLDVMLEVIHSLRQGVTESELQRVKAQYKSALVMQQESSYARSGSIVRDWYYLDRVRPMEEVTGAIDSLTVPALNDYLAEQYPEPLTVVTLGPEPLEVH